MSVAKPQNRAEFKKHILTRLGAPVLEINVSDEQLDVCIENAFQFFNERNHFNGVENAFLFTRATSEFVSYFKSSCSETVDIKGCQDKRVTPGQVSGLTLDASGSAYPQMLLAATEAEQSADITTEDGASLFVADGSNLYTDTSSSGNGKGLVVKVDKARTTAMGLVSVEIYRAGSGYEVGDVVTINGGNNDAKFVVDSTVLESPVYPQGEVSRQNNYITLPDDVVGVVQVLTSKTGFGLGGGVIPPGSLFPLMMGGLTGDACGGEFSLVTFYAMMEYLALINFLLRPPQSWNFNQRTHRLSLHGDLNINPGGFFAVECMVKPSPDLFPDLWDDMWLKEFATALVKHQWGQNLTKYNQVQMPGGITLNGDRILGDAQKELDTIRQRFAMDWADPPTAILVG